MPVYDTMDNKQLIEVLLIGDEEDTCNLIEELLSKSKRSTYNFTLICDEEAAKKVFSNEKYDICLLDNTLTKKSTLNLLQNALGFGLRKPIVYLTDNSISDSNFSIIKEVATEYLYKEELTPAYLDHTIHCAIVRSELIASLFEKEIRYQSLFERSIDSLFTATLDFDLADVNDAMEQLFGYSKEKLLTFNLKDLFSEEVEYTTFLEVLKESRLIKNHPANLETKLGNPLHCLITVMAIVDNEQGIKGYQGVIHDITNRTRTNKLLIRSEKLLMTAQLLRRLAHEVRNPLTNISLAADQIKDEIDEGHPVTSLVNIINRSTQRLTKLIHELLISSEATELKFEEYPLNKLIIQTLELAEERFQLYEVELSTILDANVNGIRIDVSKLQMALLNIINNAIEATQKGKGKVKVSTEQHEGAVVISIADNGKGISKQSLQTLFDPFTSSKKIGVGMGLTTSLNIINGHQGSIDVKSKPHEGTQFLITLPLDADHN